MNRVVGMMYFSTKWDAKEDQRTPKIKNLGGGLKYFVLLPLPGEMIQFDQYFSTELKPPTRNPRIPKTTG